MYFIIHCLDYPDAVSRRQSHFDAHRAYLATAPFRIVLAGPACW